MFTYADTKLTDLTFLCWYVTIDRRTVWFWRTSMASPVTLARDPIRRLITATLRGQICRSRPQSSLQPCNYGTLMDPPQCGGGNWGKDKDPQYIVSEIIDGGSEEDNDGSRKLSRRH